MALTAKKVKASRRLENVKKRMGRKDRMKEGRDGIKKKRYNAKKIMERTVEHCYCTPAILACPPLGHEIMFYQRFCSYKATKQVQFEVKFCSVPLDTL